MSIFPVYDLFVTAILSAYQTVNRWESMAIADTFDAYSWFTAKVPYGGDLDPLSYQTVASLAFLCAYFEEKAGSDRPQKETLRTCAERAAIHSPTSQPLQDALAFWTARYVEPGGTLNYNFRCGMNWRKGDDRATVEAVLLGQTNAPADQAMALLTIAYRLRNNLFHGLKGWRDLNDQRQNLSVACVALAGVLERL